MKQETLDRINALARKSRESGLSEEEKDEQAALRNEYIREIRDSLRANLNRISIQEADGSITDLEEKYGNIRKR